MLKSQPAVTQLKATKLTCGTLILHNYSWDWNSNQARADDHRCLLIQTCARMWCTRLQWIRQGSLLVQPCLMTRAALKACTSAGLFTVPWRALYAGVVSKQPSPAPWPLYGPRRSSLVARTAQTALRVFRNGHVNAPRRHLNHRQV